MKSEHDHRSLGQRLELFHLQEEAPGMVFWKPRGWTLFRLVEETVRRAAERQGFREVRTPQLLRQPIWEASGHWQAFASDMFLIDEDERRAAIKPVSCPGHLQIVERMAPSYRDLPIRLFELGLVHRNEASGTLHGLLRLRQFTQDDGHIVCTEEQVAEEVARFCLGVRELYARFGFSVTSVAFATRPAVRAGSDEVWDRAEAGLRSAIEQVGIPYETHEGQGAFYGPKIELELFDGHGRKWQCGTIQLDLVLPERFGVRYVDAAGVRRVPVMIHRASLGSLERFLAILLEHYEGALPAWLAPEQVLVATLGEEPAAHAASVLERLRDGQVRAIAGRAGDTLARSIALAHESGIPYVAIVGKNEAARRSVAIRARNGAQREVPLDQLGPWMARACSESGFESVAPL